MIYERIGYGVAFNINNKLCKDGTAAVCVRARQGKNRIHYSTGIRIAPQQWDCKKKMIVNHRFAKEYNIMCKEMIVALHNIEIELWKQDVMPTVHLQKVKYKKAASVERDQFGNVVVRKHCNLREFVEKHIIKGSQRKPATKKGYKAFLRVIEGHAGKNLNIEDVDYKFLCEFDAYLCKKRKNSASTVRHTHNKLRAILHEALLCDIISKNPYDKFKIQREHSKRPALDLETVRILEEYEAKTGDLFAAQFLFAIYTGLRFSDQKHLKKRDLVKTESKNGEIYTMLVLTTQKTQYPVNLPLDLLFGGKPLRLIQKYHISALANLPHNSVTNQRLKVLMHKLKVPTWKSVTWHMARHTTATWLIYLSVPITTVQHVLGHSKIMTTQLYAETSQEVIQEELRKCCLNS